jgi:hypothetical protein
MPANIANLSAGGGTPQVEIIVGHAQFASFEFFLYDANGRNPRKFGEGVNSDTIPDIFPINNPAPVSALNNHTIFWRAAAASPTGGPSEKYAFFIRVLQDGAIAGTDSRTGLVTDTPPSGFIRLVVR